jgi:hypothetical protein
MRLLHVEGSEAVAESFVDFARVQSEIEWRIFRVRDAFEAIDYLVGFKEFAERTRFPLPQIIVLSLSASTKSRLELLAWLRGESRFRHLPVVVAGAGRAKAEAVCAHELAPTAWFVQRTSCHEVLGLCECLVLNAPLRARNARHAVPALAGRGKRRRTHSPMAAVVNPSIL